jgi:hypothetical protein
MSKKYTRRRPRYAGNSAQKEKARLLCLDCLTLKLSNGRCLCGDKDALATLRKLPPDPRQII